MLNRTKARLFLIGLVCCLWVPMVLGMGSKQALAGKDGQAEFTQVNAHEMVARMGRGTNLGNTFEGNWNSQDYGQVKQAVDAFIEAGFTNIRIPINWGGRGTKYASTADEEGHLPKNAEQVKTVKKLVDYVLYKVNPQRKSEGKPEIILIINTHHEEWAMTAVVGEEAFEKNMQRLETIWREIAELFQDAPETLLFEFFNEPHLQMNTGAQAKASVIAMNQRLYRTIRGFTLEDGGKPHQYRNLIFGGHNYTSSWGLRDAYRDSKDLPGQGEDPYLIGTYHSYFKKLEDHLARLDAVYNEFVKVHNIPVYVGEFGYDHRGNITEDIRLAYRQIADQAIQHNYAFSVWDDNGWYQIYNRTTKEFNVLKDEVLGGGN